MVDERTAERLRVALRPVAAELDLVAVYLVGSRARGDHRADSDVDLAVLPRCPVDDLLGLSVEVAARLEPSLLLPVDAVVLDLRRQPLPLVGSLLRDAVLVCARDEPARVAFEVQAMALTLDFEIHAAPLRRARLDEIAAGRR